jgi:uroporphyrinogen-III synthase
VTVHRLDGVHVVVLRVGDGVDELALELRRWGADASTVRVATVSDRSDDVVRAQVGVLDRYAWVVVTSANAARRLGALATPWPPTVRIGAVGPATTRTVERGGLTVDAVAGDGTAAGLAREIDAGPVLFLAGSRARRDLDGALTARGVEVVVVVAYDTEPRTLDTDDVDALEGCEVVVAAAPSALEAVAAAPLLEAALRRRPLVTIGPTTANYARRRGLEVAASAASRDAGAVAEAVAAALAV